MEDSGLNGKLLRQMPVRTSGNLKSTLSGRSSSRFSPSYRRLNSSRTPRRESKGVFGRLQWLRSNRVVLWLSLIALWAYVGFHVQSKWAHSDHRKAEFVGYKSETGSAKLEEDKIIGTASFSANATISSATKEPVIADGKKDADSSNFGVSLGKQDGQGPARQNAPKKKRKTSERRRKAPGKAKKVVTENITSETEDGMVPKRNTSYGLIVGPFDKTEDAILGWNANKRKGTCNRKGEFARIVWSRSFVLVFHELSMTGAPLSMMELATEILSCGGTVSAVVLSRKGGLMEELDNRGIKVLRDRADFSFKTAMKADLVIAGSAVCSSWLEQYLLHFPSASNRILWWIMENRQEYFDRSKHLLNRVKMLAFLSASQSKQWLSWCDEEHIRLSSQPMIVPLSVNDELAFVAGIPCSLNTPAFSVEKMLEKRNLLRKAVRKEMGLADNNVLIMTLSSINAGKGQRLLLESALLVAEHNVSLKEIKYDDLLEEKKLTQVTSVNQTTTEPELNKQGNDVDQSNSTNVTPKKKKRKHSKLVNTLSLRNHTRENVAQGAHRNLLSEREDGQEQTLKVLIGSVGSKSNKVPYVKLILRFISRHPSLSKLVLWTRSTTHVAPLYAAADVYVINAQGIGETFGRVTIEAMAFGLPVLGTDAGGTMEIVEDKVTGLLHPIGREGIPVLAENMLYLVSNPSAREKMGARGRQLVQDKYLKHHMYEKFAQVLVKCVKIN
ncbi:uncharacterized protein LOC109716494 [Ananas comosus]|uniref:Uncharacterized protein LOC109716494 n=1 Tax=Ananas comosus TaxID=4615 RepID=A0A6P5FPG9_ANACO|nr:uncharacterized protein LOC109716494 [Ananas comosus]